MPITFTPNLEPTFRANSFNSEKTHVKQLGVDLIAGTAFLNPLATVLAALVTQIDATNTLLDTDIAVANTEATTIQGLIDGTLPTGWTNAPSPGPYDDDDMASVKVGIEAYVTRATASKANNIVFKNFLTQAGVDNFKLHNELLCGLVLSPPPGVIKPNLNGLMGLAMGITDTENRFGITFTNYLTGLFGALFTGDTTVATTKTHIDTDPIPTTYDSLNIVTAVNADPFSTTPAALVSAIGALSSPMTTYGTAVETHQGHFTTHITTDMAYYYMVTARLTAYVRAYQVSGHIQDPFYRFMYTDVFGHDDIQQTISDLADGTIT